MDRARVKAARMASLASGCLALGVGADARAGGCGVPAPGSRAELASLAGASASCFQAKDDASGAKIFYAAVIRARALPGGGAAELQRQLGAPANRWLGGDIGEWREAIAWALDWDARSPWPELEALAGGEAAAARRARASSRAAAAKLSEDLGSIDRAAFYGERIKAGLPVRDPLAGRSKPGG